MLSLGHFLPSESKIHSIYLCEKCIPGLQNVAQKRFLMRIIFSQKMADKIGTFHQNICKNGIEPPENKIKISQFWEIFILFSGAVK